MLTDGYMAKVVTMDVVIENRYGILSQIIVALSKHGFRVLKHHVESEGNSAGSVLSLWIEGKKPVDDAVRAEIRSVKGCIQVDSDAGQKSKSSAPPTTGASSDEDIATSLLKAYPDVKGVLARVLPSTPETQRDDRLHEFGKAVGKVVYQKRYALGLPVKMPAALKRIVQPEVKAFGKVGVSGKTVGLKDNTLCHSSESESMCSFVHGLVEGLVVNNPNSANAEVARVSCKSHGDANCSFEIID